MLKKYNPIENSDGLFFLDNDNSLIYSKGSASSSMNSSNSISRETFH
jgi:sensor domain CHASE-containing protein